MPLATNSIVRAEDLAATAELERNSALETLHSNRRMLYFSDGLMEELSSSESDVELDEADKCISVQFNEHELPLVPRLRYKAQKLGNNILAGIDYVGGGLAAFLGISTPKYASELAYHKRSTEQAAANTDIGNDSWQQQQGGTLTNTANKNNNSFNIYNRNEVIVLCEQPRLPSRH